MRCPECECPYVEQRKRNPRTGGIIWICTRCGAEWEMNERHGW